MSDPMLAEILDALVGPLLLPQRTQRGRTYRIVGVVSALVFLLAVSCLVIAAVWEVVGGGLTDALLAFLLLIATIVGSCGGWIIGARGCVTAAKLDGEANGEKHEPWAVRWRAHQRGREALLGRPGVV